MLVLVAAMAIALLAELRPDAGNTGQGPAAQRPARADPAALAAARQRADLAPCPPLGNGNGPAALRALLLTCAADGRPVDVGRLVAGRTVVLNLWAYWCGPCRDELPAMAEYQRRVGDAVTVVTVHQDPDELAALTMLAELGVRLPTLADGDRRIAAALRVPNVMPATVLLAADGTVTAILPRAFSDADEIAAAVDEQRGGAP